MRWIIVKPGPLRALRGFVDLLRKPLPTNQAFRNCVLFRAIVTLASNFLDKSLWAGQVMTHAAELASHASREACIHRGPMDLLDCTIRAARETSGTARMKPFLGTESTDRATDPFGP
jgi:hypothetical protein